MKRIFCVLLFFLLLSQVTVAGDEAEAEKILKASVNEVFAVMSNKMLSMDQKKSRVVKITSSVFDYSLIAKLTLGKKHWIKLDARQRAEFTTLFEKRFKSTFIDKFDLFSDEKVFYKPAVIRNKKNVWIPTVLFSKGNEYLIIYKMFKSKNGWKICDLEIEGVSQLRSNRSQYHNTIKKCGVEGLLAKMREKKIENKKQ